MEVILVIGIVLVLAELAWLAWQVRTLRQTPPATREAHPPPDPAFIGRIDEAPIPSGQSSYEFWMKVHRDATWNTLSHIFQADTRNYLRDGKDALAAGHPDEALFWFGKAHEAAFNAVRPEYTVQRFLRLMAEQQRIVHEEAPGAPQPTPGADNRPSPRWGQ